jgi:hypothetical protein
MKRTALALTFILAFLVSSIVEVHFGTAQSGTISGNYWITKAPMQVARADLGVAAVDGKIYAIGGANQTFQAASIPDTFPVGENPVGVNEQYDPATNDWAFKDQCPTHELVLP